jgi:hypothetical protein
LWRGWKCNFFCLWCKMEVFKDGYGVQTSLTRYLSEQAFGSSRLQSLIYVLVAETSWFGHSLLNGSNIVCKNFWRLCRQFGIYCTRTRSCLSLGKKWHKLYERKKMSRRKKAITSVGLVYTRHVSNINTGYKNPTRYDLRQY